MMTALMVVMRLFVLQNVREMTGFAAATATASPLSGCVTRKTTAWTGVTRKTARRRKLLHLNLTPSLVLALTTGVETVFASQLAGHVMTKTTVTQGMMRTPNCVGRRSNVGSSRVAQGRVFLTGGCVMGV